VYEFEVLGLECKKFIFKIESNAKFFLKLNSYGRYDDLKLNECISPGNAALKIFIKICNKHNYKIKFKIKNTYEQQIKDAHIGGRNEFIADPDNYDTLYSLDFNLMYLNCMKEGFLYGRVTRTIVSEISKPGFYNITYISKDFFYPILPHKNNLTQESFFCNGVQTGTFWFEEVLLFLKNGGQIMHIHYMYAAEKYIP
jgi:hypothetical protein